MGYVAERQRYVSGRTSCGRSSFDVVRLSRTQINILRLGLHNKLVDRWNK